jgi:tetratricopeptide (TPR) repeat protein
VPGRASFDLESALAEDVPEQQGEPDAPAARASFDLRSALEDDLFAQEDEAGEQAANAAAESFFDLQSALEADTSLRFDYDASADDFPSSDQDGSLPSVLSVVKDIALQDPRQDTPLFHFNLGIAYMQCADYEQAVDELLSALYGIPDKIGCYLRLAECSLKLQRRELACGFLREALDHPDIRPEQSRAVRKKLDELSAP